MGYPLGAPLQTMCSGERAAVELRCRAARPSTLVARMAGAAAAAAAKPSWPLRKLCALKPINVYTGTVISESINCSYTTHALLFTGVLGDATLMPIVLPLCTLIMGWPSKGQGLALFAPP